MSPNIQAKQPAIQSLERETEHGADIKQRTGASNTNASTSYWRKKGDGDYLFGCQLCPHCISPGCSVCVKAAEYRRPMSIPSLLVLRVPRSPLASVREPPSQPFDVR